uniref:Uncharacterized protein n=1 Tax=Alexandrium catenella TaxID=2925 RepID=A0A7S1S420_ALECA
MATAMSRDQMLNDFTNTGVVAALIGGFALSDFSSIKDVSGTMSCARAVVMFLATHLCTASTISASLCYRAVNALDEGQAETWSVEMSSLRLMVFALFAMGGVLYVVGVVFVGLSTHQALGWQVLFATVGAMCCMMLMGVAMLTRRTPKRSLVSSD